MALGAAFRPPTVGLDIGSSAVKAVALRRTPIRLVARGRRRGPDARGRPAGRRGRRADRGQRDRQPSCSTRCACAARRVAAALSGHAVIVKRLSLPAMSQAELTEAIPWEAEQYIPFDLSDVQLDYQVVNARQRRRQARRSTCCSWPPSATASTTAPAVIAQSRPAAGRARHRGVRARQRLSDELPGADRPAVRADSRRPQRDHRLPARARASRSFTRDISHRRPAARRRAQARARPGRRRRPDGQAHPARPVSRPTSAPSRCRPCCATPARSSCSRSARRSTSIARPRRSNSSAASCCPAARGRPSAWSDLLASEFGAPVDVFDPFRRVARPSRAIGADATGPAYAVAVGLAMRQEGDR